MAFNTSTRKEDVSIKYKGLNIHKARDETRVLEADSRKMEERLNELKMVMSREKEEREHAQGGFWKAGKEGALGGYAQEVLKKPKQKGEKTKKVKILKDEPIAPPVRNRGPGTMGYIAQRGGGSGKENKVRGPRCGQCEEKGAQVSCLECGEDYCAGCFAAFHLRGNLKKHRSVPLGSKISRTPRGSVTPRKPGSISSRSPTSSNGSQMAPLSENAAHSPEKRADSPVENGDSLLLAGDYNEAESAAEFQAALRQWRGEDSVVPKPPPRPRPPPVSPVRSPIVSMEHGTGTESGLEPQAPDIKFHSSLTYAEKLMLKRHRRTELKPLPDDLRSRSENRSRSSEYPPLEQLMTSRSETLVMDGPEETLVEVLREPTVDAPDDGITWRDMHRAMKSDSIIRSESRSESRVSIIELNEDIPVKSRRRGRGSDVEQTSKYKVSLVGREEDLELLSARKQSARGAKVNPSSSAKRRDKSTMLPPSASTYEETSLKHSRKVTKNTEVDDTPDLSIDLSASKKGQSSRPKSNARPRSSRVKSSRAGQSRPQSRAMSRTETRLAFYGEGELTKAPSESLKEVARMTPRHDPTPFIPTMGEFFTNGVVTQEEVRDRVMTPRKNRVKSKEVANDAGIPKWKVSYNLYNMGPRSWKPDASLKDQVDDDVAVVTIEETSDRLRDFLEPDTDDKRLETVSYSITEGVSRTESTFIDQKKSKSFSREDTSKVTTSARSRTPRVTSSRGMPQTSVRSATDTERTPRPDTERTPRPDSRAIVVDGDDLSSYDFNQETTEMNDEDEDSLYQLEWELASHDGRITEDGTLSRLSIAITPEADEEQSDVTPEVPLAMGVSSLIAGAASPGASLDTRMNHLMDDFEEMEEKLLDAEEVKALH